MHKASQNIGGRWDMSLLLKTEDKANYHQNLKQQNKQKMFDKTKKQY